MKIFKEWHCMLIISTGLLLCIISWGLTTSGILSALQSSSKDNSAANSQSYSTVSADMSNSFEGNDYKRIFNKADTVIKRTNSVFIFPNKSKLSQIDSLITYLLTNEVVSTQVMKGENKWLFYKSSEDGNTIADFEGKELFSEAEKKQMKETLLQTQNELQKRGIDFYLFIAPNKESIYYEDVPSVYKHAKFSRTDLLVQYFQNNEINVVYPKAELDGMKKGQYPLYFYYDTHWNQIGAYIGTNSLLSYMGLPISTLSNDDIFSKSLTGNYHIGANDDLAKIIGLRKTVFNDENEYSIKGTQKIDWNLYEKEQESTEECTVLLNDNAKSKKTVLLVGDSFRSAMLPLLSEEFSKVCVCHRDNYREEYLSEYKPDYFIAEYVERYSSDIKNADFIMDTK